MVEGGGLSSIGCFLEVIGSQQGRYYLLKVR